MIQNQFARRNLSSWTRGGLSLKLDEFYKQKGKTNQGTRTDLTFVRNLTNVEPIDTKKELAKIAGISYDTIYKIKEIKSTAPIEVLSDLEKKLIANEISINQAHKFVRTIKTTSNAGLVARKILDELDKKPGVSLENKTKEIIK